MRNINLFELGFTHEERDAVLEVLEDGWITQGPRVSAFEQLFESEFNASAVAVGSCTAALHLAHLIGGATSNKEVIVPSLTFAATPNSVIYTGANVVFADIKSPDDWTIDPADIENKVSEKTCCVTPMHYAGFPADMDNIAAICKRHDLFLVEDACHALGSFLGPQRLGTIGDIGCFSFYGNKIMTTGEGGMMVIKNPAHATVAKSLRSHGMTNVAWDRIKGAMSYDVARLGFNYRLDDIRAAIGIVQFGRLQKFIQRRSEIVSLYKKRLKSIDEVSIPFEGMKQNQSNYIFPILLKFGDRETFRENLLKSGIQTSIHYLPCHTFAFYKRHAVALPVTDYVARKCLSLPLFPSMTDDDVNYICEKIYEYTRKL